MSEETLEPPLPPIDARTEAVAERLFGLKWALRKDSTEIIHEEWRTAPEWIRDGYLRQAIEVLAAADQAQPASAAESDLVGRIGSSSLLGIAFHMSSYCDFSARRTWHVHLTHALRTYAFYDLRLFLATFPHATAASRTSHAI